MRYEKSHELIHPLLKMGKIYAWFPQRCQPRVGAEMGCRVKAEGLIKEIWVGPSHWQASRVKPCMEFVMHVLDRHPKILTEETLKILGE